MCQSFMKTDLILEYIKLVRLKLSEWLNNLLNTETRDFLYVYSILLFPVFFPRDIFFTHDGIYFKIENDLDLLK